MKRKILMRILWMFPKKIAHKILYRIEMKQKLNLSNPGSFNEKIQYQIVNHYGKKEADLTDKYLVKKYIEQLKIEQLNVPKTYFIVDEHNYKKSDFPNEFVLKCNHGSGNVFICNNKKTFDLDNAIKILAKVKKENFAISRLEYHYSYIRPVILCEEYLNDLNGICPIDYKFFCFDGYVDCVMVCSDRDSGNYRDFYDTKWNYLDYIVNEKKSIKENIKPKNFEVMVDIASKISKGFPFVRVDLYNINGKVYFSEMTFTPAAGLATHYNEKCNIHLGSLLKINDKN